MENLDKLNQETIISRLLQWSEHRSDDIALEFFSENLENTLSMSFADLTDKVKHIAAGIREHMSHGEKALILLERNEEYVLVLFACFYAGITAIPMFPSKRKDNSKQDRFSSIIANARPEVVITSRTVLEHLPLTNDLNAILFEDLNNVVDLMKVEVPPTPTDIAFLQYTSGSLGDPKGVMVSHRNIMENMRAINLSFGIDDESTVVTWLPLFHDMGLIGGLLQPIYAGIRCCMITPTAFIRRPVRWLQLISKYRKVFSGGPNFAFELCTQKIKQSDLIDLDLSGWFIAFNGAEKVRASTLRSFSEKFSVCGFQSQSFLPVFGMAEATLLVSSGERRRAPLILKVDKSALSENRVVESQQENAMEIVSLGRPASGLEVLIADAESLEPLAEGLVGEILIRGGSVASGYLDKDELNQQVFATGPSGNWYRTGDLGVIHDQQLYFVGRQKEMLVIRGSNYAPQDIEHCIQINVPALAVDRGAAVPAIVNGEERLVVVQEVDKLHQESVGFSQLVTQIKRNLASTFALKPEAVILLQSNCLPQTSSGKIKRKYIAQHLSEFIEQALHADISVALKNEINTPQSKQIGDKASSLIAWLKSYCRKRVYSRLIDERRTIPPHIVLDLGNRGILGLNVAPHYGGLGLSTFETLKVIEHIASFDLTLASFVGVHLALGVQPIEHHGSSEQKLTILTDAAKGRSLLSFALTEENAGSNPKSLKTTAVEDSSGGWLLSGEKIWIGTGAWSTVALVFAKMVDQHGIYKGVTCFAIPVDREGVNASDEYLTMGVKGMVQNRMQFDRVSVSLADVVGRSGAGMDVAQGAMTLGRLGIGAIALGGMKRAYMLAHSYAKNRAINTGSLLHNPVSKIRLAIHRNMIVCAEALLYVNAEIFDTEPQFRETLTMASKILIPEWAGCCIDQSMQLTGGRGYMDSNKLSQLYRDARLLRIFEGPTETLTMHLGALYAKSIEQTEFLLGDLLDPQQYLYLNNHFLDLQAMSEESENKVAVRQWQHYCLGQLVAMQIAQAALQRYAVAQLKEAKTDYASAHLWLEGESENLIRNSQMEWTRLQERDMPDFAQQLKDEIGETTEDLGQEITTFDSLLRDDEVPVKIGVALLPDAIPEVPIESSEDIFAITGELSTWLAGKLELPVTTLDVNRPFAEYGFDSIDSIELIEKLESTFGIKLDPTAAWNYPTVTDMARYVFSEIYQQNSKKSLPLLESGKDIMNDYEDLSNEELVKIIMN